MTSRPPKASMSVANTAAEGMGARLVHTLVSHVNCHCTPEHMGTHVCTYTLICNTQSRTYTRTHRMHKDIHKRTKYAVLLFAVVGMPNCQSITQRWKTGTERERGERATATPKHARGCVAPLTTAPTHGGGGRGGCVALKRQRHPVCIELAIRRSCNCASQCRHIHTHSPGTHTLAHDMHVPPRWWWRWVHPRRT